MKVLITYDVATSHDKGQRRLTRIAKKCKDYGVRVQKSVFECVVTPAQWEDLKSGLLKLYDSSEDSFRFYMLGSKWEGKVEHHGAHKPTDVTDTLIV